MRASCRKCREPSHGQLTCQENAMKQKLANYVEIKMTEALVRQCPSCGKKFIKIDGCNKMVSWFSVDVKKNDKGLSSDIPLSPSRRTTKACRPTFSCPLPEKRQRHVVGCVVIPKTTKACRRTFLCRYSRNDKGMSSDTLLSHFNFSSNVTFFFC